MGSFNGRQSGYFNGDNARAADRAAEEAGRKASRLRHIVFVQRGNTSTLHLNDQQGWHVVRDVWEGRRLLNSIVHGVYDTRAEAELHRDEVQQEYTSD